jgi:hypothetical protein
MVLLFCFLSAPLNAQDSTRVMVVDTTTYATKFGQKWHMQPHSPLKATVFSAVIPGAGQFYNGKWWKAGIAYAGIGTCIYFIQDNNKRYQTYRKAYIASVDDDETTVPEIEGNAAFYNQWQEQYHRWRDVSYMCLVGVYVLQIIDANVDGHLFYYDVSPKMSLSIHPYAIPSAQLNAGFGMSLHF